MSARPWLASTAFPRSTENLPDRWAEAAGGLGGPILLEDADSQGDSTLFLYPM